MIEILLELTKEEAIWLKAVVQNPLYGEHIDEEDMKNRKMRFKIFNTIDKILKEE